MLQPKKKMGKAATDTLDITKLENASNIQIFFLITITKGFQRRNSTQAEFALLIAVNFTVDVMLNNFELKKTN